jgi:hypothetical protein
METSSLSLRGRRDRPSECPNVRRSDCRAIGRQAGRLEPLAMVGLKPELAAPSGPRTIGLGGGGGFVGRSDGRAIGAPRSFAHDLFALNLFQHHPRLVGRVDERLTVLAQQNEASAREGFLERGSVGRSDAQDVAGFKCLGCGRRVVVVEPPQGPIRTAPVRPVF